MVSILQKAVEARIRGGILGAARLELNQGCSGAGLSVIYCTNPSHLPCK